MYKQEVYLNLCRTVVGATGVLSDRQRSDIDLSRKLAVVFVSITISVLYLFDIRAQINVAERLTVYQCPRDMGQNRKNIDKYPVPHCNRTAIEAPPWNGYITKTRLFKYIENFTTKKWKFSDKKFWYFFSHFCSKHRCGYSLEPPEAVLTSTHDLCFEQN